MKYLKSIAAELGLVFLLVAMAPILTAYFVTNNIFSHAIHKEKSEALGAIADSTQARAESYVLGMIHDVTTLAKSPDLVQLLNAPQHIVTPGAAVYDFLRAFTLEKGYYDLLLVDRNGDIRFSLKRESDLGQNIHGKFLKQTQLAQTVDAANTLLQTEVSNFAYYPPTNDHAAFLAAPIFERGIIVGNVVLQIDNRELNAIVNRYSGLGESGEILVATLEGGRLIITEPARHDDKLQTHSIDPEHFAPLQMALRGEAGMGEYTDYRGHSTLAVWRYLPSLNWGMLVKIDTQELYAPIQSFKHISLRVMLGSVLLVLFGFLVSNRFVSRPIVRLAQAVQSLNEEALPEAIIVPARHEIGKLVTAFNTLISSIRTHQFRLEDRVALRTSELANAKAHIETLMNSVAEGIYGVDMNGDCTFINSAGLHLLGYQDRNELIGQHMHDLIHHTRPDGTHYPVTECRLYSCLKSKESIHVDDEWFWRKDGSSFPVDYWSRPMPENEGGAVITFIDITSRKAAEEEIRNLAFFDPLTNLPNRRLLMDRLQQTMASSARNGRMGALLFIDLDNFKTLNDTLGHDIGDLLLKQVALRLKAGVREGDTVARLGGDEFLMILEGLSEQAVDAAAQTKILGEKILAALSLPYQLAGNVQRSTPSIGATLINGHQSTLEELMKQADIAMYQAKNAGRNMLCFFDPQMQDIINARSKLEKELRIALEKQQFQLYYQIQVDHALRPLGAEALIRWIHPKRGLIPPVEFIPILEEIGLIRQVGWWVLQTACAQLQAWQQKESTRALTLAVNVSARQFHETDFSEQVRSAIQLHDFNPNLLKLELTESMLVEEFDLTIATMLSLRDIGVGFSLDDFGTGYSSLQYLKRLPIDQLKIDRTFVRDITMDGNDRAIIGTIIAMAHSLKLEAIAEGVETEEQRQFLFDSGCMQYQGYLFGKPVPINEFEESLYKT